MNRTSAVLILIASCQLAHAGPSLQEARQRLLRGNYEEAREIYTELAKDAKNKIAAAIGISLTLESEGNYEAALAAVDKALKSSADDADLLARRAELLYLRGRWDDAEKAAKKALDKAEDHLLARWIAAQILRDRGEVDMAQEEFRWFVRKYNDSDITDPDQLRIVFLATCERARWFHQSDQYQFVVDEYGDLVKKDKDCWWAHYEKGRLFLEKYNKAEAEKAFDHALTINPQAAEALAYKGMVAMQRLDLKDAENYAEQALRINPRTTVALLLKADIFLFAGDVGSAMKELDKSLAVNPRDEPTLARVAACLHAQKKHKEFDALLKDVEKHDSRPAIFYTELADVMEGRKLYDDAEKYLRQAIELQPKLPAAPNQLGLLYMRIGKEDEARKLLDKAFDADRFNVRVSNTLRVLSHLDKYETRKTEHFIIRYDPKHDKILANFLAKYLEEMYEEYAKLFNYRPKEPILIEVFNTHQMFSGRVTALPDLHTIGACTGSVVAMVSPRDKSKIISKPFNWVRVMRHELVHVFNLDQTRFQVPHWFTEGLAVTLEGKTTPPRWNQLLANKMKAGELLNLDNVLLGFVRPRSPDEWQLAYLQSQLYVEFVTKKHGEKAIGSLLAAFAEGLDTASALEKAIGMKKAVFEKEYTAYLEEKVKQNGVQGGGKVLTFKQLKEAHAKDPDDADIAAQLADRFYQIGNKKEARKLAEKVLTDKGKHPLAAYVKALLLADSGDADVAMSLLETNVDEKTTEPKALRLLAKMFLQAKRFPDAARILEQGRKLDANDPAWLLDLGKLYVQSGDKEKLLSVLKDAAKLDPDDLVARRTVAQSLLKEGKLAEAEEYARMALEIDVLDAAAQDTLIEALMGQNKEEELKQLKKLLER